MCVKVIVTSKFGDLQESCSPDALLEAPMVTWQPCGPPEARI